MTSQIFGIESDQDLNRVIIESNQSFVKTSQIFGLA